jgi:hypothetical protein
MPRLDRGIQSQTIAQRLDCRVMPGNDLAGGISRFSQFEFNPQF